jgi:hypothetical protein
MNTEWNIGRMLAKYPINRPVVRGCHERDERSELYIPSDGCSDYQKIEVKPQLTV